MAKIIQQPTHPGGWPYHITHQCEWCGATYSLESGDRVDHRDDSFWAEEVYTYCPSCQRRVTTALPADLRPRYRHWTFS